MADAVPEGVPPKQLGGGEPEPKLETEPEADCDSERAEAEAEPEAEPEAAPEAAPDEAEAEAEAEAEPAPAPAEGTIARDIREGNWLVPKSPAACRGGDLQVAKLRLILCFLHNERLTEDCPLLLMGGRVPETIAANFAPVSSALWRSARWSPRT